MTYIEPIQGALAKRQSFLIPEKSGPHLLLVSDDVKHAFKFTRLASDQGITVSSLWSLDILVRSIVGSFDLIVLAQNWSEISSYQKTHLLNNLISRYPVMIMSENETEELQTPAPYIRAKAQTAEQLLHQVQNFLNQRLSYRHLNASNASLISTT